jgi:hypothetical protein
VRRRRGLGSIFGCFRPHTWCTPGNCQGSSEKERGIKFKLRDNEKENPNRKNITLGPYPVATGISCLRFLLVVFFVF